jgi:hypothetical protein
VRSSLWRPFERRNLTTVNSGAGTLAFVIRAGVNLILLLTRLKRIKKYGAVHHENPRLIVPSESTASPRLDMPCLDRIVLDLLQC